MTSLCSTRPARMLMLLSTSSKVSPAFVWDTARSGVLFRFGMFRRGFLFFTGNNLGNDRSLLLRSLLVRAGQAEPSRSRSQMRQQYRTPAGRKDWTSKLSSGAVFVIRPRALLSQGHCSVRFWVIWVARRECWRGGGRRGGRRRAPRGPSRCRAVVWSCEVRSRM